MWVRGLKLKKTDKKGIKSGVAPHVGAWIETLGKVAYLFA